MAGRILSLDALRGLVMIIMALDHARDFLHIDAMADSPTNLATTTPLLFFTRWITHLCAPTFVFLAGTSAWLTRQRLGASFRSQMIRRGGWLIFLEFSVVSFALWFDIRFRTQLFEVIAAIGFGLIVVGLLSGARVWIIAALSIGLIFLHDAVGLIPFSQPSLIKTVLMPLMFQAPFPLSPESIFLVAYPPLPWLGMLLAGYVLGPWIASNDPASRKHVLILGVFALALFVILRLINRYGDFPWSNQPKGLFTALSFINVTKYPPSLQFTLSMLGLMLIVLSLMPSRLTTLSKILSTYGRVPLFYFIVHLYVIHFLMLVVLLMQGYSWSDLNFGMFGQGRPSGAGGLSLGGTYICWVAIVAALYPVCRWYSGLRSRVPDSLLAKYL